MPPFLTTFYLQCSFSTYMNTLFSCEGAPECMSPILKCFLHPWMVTLSFNDDNFVTQINLSVFSDLVLQ